MCRVLLWHDYFLDLGETSFAALSADKQREQLKLYSAQEYMSIRPTTGTRRLMAGHKIELVHLPDGFSLHIKVTAADEDMPLVQPSEDLLLTFVLKVADVRFHNYTALGTDSAKCFYFGNARPITEGVSFAYLPLESENTQITDSFMISEDGTEDIHETLTVPEQNELFGVVQLRMRGDTESRSVLDTNLKRKSPNPSFKLHFSNRNTFWRYIQSADSSVLFTSANAIPLTKYGYVEMKFNGKDYPNPNANYVVPENNNFISETYI